MSRWDRLPGAKAFVDSLAEHPESRLLFPKERFAKLLSGVFGGTSVDLQGESLPVAGLCEMASRVKREPIWINDNHNPLKPPVGRILDAEVFSEEGSGDHYIVGVVGVYDGNSYTKFADLNIDPTASGPIEELFPCDSADEPACSLVYDPHEISAALINEAMVDAPTFVSAENTAMRKGISEDHVAQILLIVNQLLFLYNPLVKGALERVGHGVGDTFNSWTKKAFSTVLSRIRRKTLFQWETALEGCAADFMIETNDPAAVAAAADSIGEGSQGAAYLVRNLAPYRPQRVAYVFDELSKKWMPLYAVTLDRGVISDRSFLIVLEKYTGFSIGGRATRSPVE